MLYAAFARLDPTLATDQIGGILKSASNENKGTLEVALDALRRMLLGDQAVGQAPTLEGDRESFFQHLYALQDSSAYTELEGAVRVQVLTNMDAETLGLRAQDDFGHFLALQSLVPFALEGAEPALSAAHGALFANWQADQAKRAAGDLDLTYTEAYLTDRARMLHYRSLYDRQDRPYGESLRVAGLPLPVLGDALFADAASGIALNIDGVDLSVIGKRLVHFGSEQDEAIAGGGAEDRLYGGGGADILDGGEGMNYLEGNEGADVLILAIAILGLAFSGRQLVRKAAA